MRVVRNPAVSQWDRAGLPTYLPKFDRHAELGIIPNLSLEYAKKNMPAHTMPNEHEPPSSGILEGCLYTFTDDEQQTRTVKFGKVLFRPSGIIGRCTLIIRVLCVCHNGIECKCSWAGLELIMKISFPSRGRESEVAIIKHCMEKAAGLEWVKKHLPQVLSSFSVAFAENSPQAELAKYFPGYEKRVMRGSFQQELRPLRELKSAAPPTSSPNTDAPHPGPSSNHRTGTPPFIAHGQLAEGWNDAPRYRHDLESLFYVMLLLTCHYKAPGVSAASLRYGDWYHAHDFPVLGSKKSALIRSKFWSPPVETFFNGFASWLGGIRVQLWNGFAALE
ncbi:hypothetical protein BT96DRAFT_969622 [Gymnopus androsaceus JB14]|uniref:Fungal-type protein kinase domain-containing protein n=1 Tax=Gymnopus androsaceus JB14 TaxID=1447944 RepID=A0A6A4IPY9_9AGAR|nr:hypothetical protein BT96DRAFT_969622 [Gymnopus androsaceus JB14]